MPNADKWVEIFVIQLLLPGAADEIIFCCTFFILPE